MSDEEIKPLRFFSRNPPLHGPGGRDELQLRLRLLADSFNTQSLTTATLDMLPGTAVQFADGVIVTVTQELPDPSAEKPLRKKLPNIRIDFPSPLDQSKILLDQIPQDVIDRYGRVNIGFSDGTLLKDFRLGEPL